MDPMWNDYNKLLVKNPKPPLCQDLEVSFCEPQPNA